MARRLLAVPGLLALAAYAAFGADLGLLEEKAFQAAVQRVAPAVVRIETIGGLEQVGNVLFGTGPTTGLVVSEDGFILSSAFNFLNRPSSILVQVPGGQRQPAKLVATDHSRMLALLKIDPAKPLPVPRFAEELPRVGQWAIAVGRAFDTPQPNLSVGIISAVNRIWGKAIQTDAAVSPNNYGGPLIDLRGNVLGLLVPLSPDGSDEVSGVQWYDSGIGFAIAVQDLPKAIGKLKEGKDLYPGILGVRFAEGSLLLAEPVIAGSTPNSPAAKAGLKEGDRIVEVAGRKTSRAADVKQQISRHYAGETIRVVLLRGSQRLEKQVALVDKIEPYATPFLGVLPVRLGTPAQGTPGESPQGVAVRHVFEASPAAKAGLAAGDVLVALAGTPIRDVAALRTKLASYQPGDKVELEIRRGNETRKLTATLASLPEELPAETLPMAGAMRAPQPAGSTEAQRPEVGMVRFQVGQFTNEVWGYIPQAYNPAVAHGLVVWLHGQGGRDPKALLAQWQPLCDRDGLILVAPQAADPETWQGKELAMVRGLVGQVHSRYTIDPTRVVACGQQDGGKLACLLALADRELVRAVVVVGAPLVGRIPPNAPEHPLAFYVARAAEDPKAEQIDQSVQSVRAMKYPVCLKDLGKKPRALTAEELLELARWIDTLDRI